MGDSDRAKETAPKCGDAIADLITAAAYEARTKANSRLFPEIQVDVADLFRE